MNKNNHPVFEKEKKTVTMTQAPKGKKLSDKEKWKYANFTNNYVFSKILRDNPQITKELIQLFVDDLDIQEIKSITNETIQDGRHDSKTTYLDVEVILADDTAVLIEMQVQRVRDFIPRMRYYRSEADIRKLHHGQPYSSLPNVIQIIVCLFDPVGDGRYIYDYEMREKHTNASLAANGQRIILLNCRGFRGEISDDQFDFVKYLRGDEASSDLAKNIDVNVSYLKYDESAEGEFMHFEDYIKDRTEAAVAETKAETKAEDIALVFNNFISRGSSEQEAVSTVSEIFSVSREEILKIIQSSKEN